MLRPLLTLLLLSAAGATAAPPLDGEIPETLRPWVPWVLAAHPDARCPTLGEGSQRACLWASRLTLDLGARGGSFAGEWRSFGRGAAALPGGPGAWPEDVQVDDRPAAVTARDGRPVVWLDAGPHRVRGRFVWNAMPQLFAVPPEIGLVALTLDGSRVTTERREADGRLWLGAAPAGAAGPAESRADLDVRRLVRDEIPLALETRLDLDVAGPSRELTIEGALLPGFVPTFLDAAIPARLEARGALVLQVRPGRYTVTLGARHEGPVLQLALPEAPPAAAASDRASPPLRDDEEVWAFEAEPALRLVELSGVPAVDPQHTTLPPAWRGFPAFLMRPGSVLRFDQRRRGDADPAPDELRLRRELWLDFDGAGYTAQDRITGRLHRSWRLDAGPRLALGRAALHGVDQAVTTLPGSAARGVELRESELDMDADSRIEGPHSRLPAVGWSHDFQDVAASLQLPPGWRLVLASGVDEAEPTWIGSWSLLDLFFVLVIALAAGRLLGPASGALALLTLALTWLEPRAPQTPFAAAVIAEALARALPVGRLRRAMRLVQLVVLGVLSVSAVSFLVEHLRTALHPTLERPWARIGEGEAPELTRSAPAAAKEASPAAAPSGDAPERRRASLYSALPGDSGGAVTQAASPSPRLPDPTIPITTGPGRPEWSWHEVRLAWRGPVRADQEMSLVLLSPGAGLLLALLRAGLVAALVVAFVRAARAGGHAGGDAPPGSEAALPARSGAGIAGAAAAIVLFVLGGGASPARADDPGSALLGELERRLLRPPECAPSCAAIGRLRVEATPQVLRLRLEVSAAAMASVTLPGGAGHWLPEDVVLDGRPAGALQRDEAGTLWLAVEPGTHTVVMQGRIGSADILALPLPLAPSRVESELTGFALEGVRPDGTAEGTLRLVRDGAARGDPGAPPLHLGGAEPGAAETPALPPFFHVTRRLSLGLRFEVETNVARATPLGVAASLAVPLLPGESVTSELGRVDQGRLLVTFAPGQQLASWRSVLMPAAALALRAPEGVPWAETWIVDASPLWHVEASGIAPILDDGESTRLRTYRPWPGEGATLTLARPLGVDGATLTIDRSALEVSPGQRATDVSLALTMRSSRGGQRSIVLPAGSELLAASIDGRPLPLRLDDGKLVLPIEPRSQLVSLRWREAHGMKAQLRTPAVDLGTPSVNAFLAVAMPLDRWTLFVSGPPIGPAVLFWSLLAVLVPVAYALARLRSTPLGVASWLALGVGLTQVPIWASAVVAGWLLALGWRGRRAATLSDVTFRLVQIGLVQIGLVLGTVVALVVLFDAIAQGLLGRPEMQIAGNGSEPAMLRWYQDRAGATLPQARIVSLPLWVYRVAMLVWALWIAAALVGWLRWGWEQLGAGGLWRPARTSAVARWRRKHDANHAD